ncbi:ComEA family DNA-binding protein [Streptomyces sudanensis]|nr:ComEA family DNA-binding protein [Streptomyces sudanensis]MCQ0000461.1 ComEA family DNA-binding protein [Streptomyces sudanensis]
MATRTRSVIRAAAAASPRGSLPARTPAATSGPGRARGSDGRTRDRANGRSRGRHRAGDPAAHRTASPEPALRSRADALMRGVEPPHRPAGPTTPPEAPDPPYAPPAAPPVGAGERWRLALRERLPVWVQARCGFERRTLGALAVVLAVGVVLAARYFWAGGPETVRAPEVVRHSAAAVTASAEPPPPAAAPPPGPPSAAPPSGVVVVDVNGRVRRPGVLRLPAGARVVDALRAAGGVPPGTDTTGLNKARVLVDGEHVLVGVPAAAGPPGAPPPAAPPGAAGGGAATGPVSLNTATVEQLDTLPGVGPVLARHIVEHRARHGGFRSVDELREVRGIGARRFADLRPLVRP